MFTQERAQHIRQEPDGVSLSTWVGRTRMGDLATSKASPGLKGIMGVI